MSSLQTEVTEMISALRRARLSIIAVAVVHVVTVLAGIVMVHTGNQFALSYRDRLVGKALMADPVSLAFQRGDNLRAALIESARTQWACLTMGLTGPTVIFPFLLSGYRGWVGGIVSVDGDHASRLREPRQGTYYLSVILLQIIPYALAGGAGVNLGLTYFRPRAEYAGEKWLGYPKEAIWDFVRIMVFIVPFVIIANFWEFLSPLNL